MSDAPLPQPDYALQVRSNRWRLQVSLPSMAEAAAVVARNAKDGEAVKVAVEVYDPVKDAYERKDYLTFAWRQSGPTRRRLPLHRRGTGRLSALGTVAVAVLAIPVVGLAIIGARSLMPGPPTPGLAPKSTEAVVLPPPSRALPREWTGAPERTNIPSAFHGEWATDCAAARITGTGTMTVTARALFGQSANWVRVIGSRVLINTGPDGITISTQVRSDGLVLYLEERFSEIVQSRAERGGFTPERPLILSKCL